MKKRIVFIIHTEYHLIEAISYILNGFPASLYESYIYRVSNGRGRLDRFHLDIESIPAKYDAFYYSYNYMPSFEMRRFLEGIIALKPETAVIFDDGNYWTSFFLKRLKGINCRVCLAPDGANVYFPNNLPIKEVIRRFVQSAVFCYSHFLLPPFMPLVHHNYYAYNKYLDEIWAEYPDFIENKKKRKCLKKEVLNNDTIIENVNKVFGFKGFPNSIRDNGAIVFFDAPYEESIVKQTVGVLQTIKRRYPTVPMYIKLHPNTSQKQSELYEQIDNIQFFPTDYPAELYIQNLSNTVLISVVSNVMFCYNQSCKYYWLYPIIKGLRLNRNHCNPTPYIIEVHEVADITI